MINVPVRNTDVISLKMERCSRELLVHKKNPLLTNEVFKSEFEAPQTSEVLLHARATRRTCS